jgi:hypothetical protein
MLRALEQAAADHFGASALLRTLKRARPLINAPVALARDEDRRHVDRAAGKHLQFAIEGASGALPVADHRLAFMQARPRPVEGHVAEANGGDVARGDASDALQTMVLSPEVSDIFITTQTLIQLPHLYFFSKKQILILSIKLSLSGRDSLHLFILISSS